MAEAGERDPAKIAKSALGMIREHEQIRRSKARVTAASYLPQGKTIGQKLTNFSFAVELTDVALRFFHLRLTK
jgi:hypothetical protein